MLKNQGKSDFTIYLIDIVNQITYKQATDLFNTLGLDMSGAVNLFLHQCVLRGGLPFNIEMPHYNQRTLDAMDEAKRISRDPDVKGYNSMYELRRTLEE